MKNLVYLSMFLSTMLITFASCGSDFTQEDNPIEVKNDNQSFTIHVLYGEKDYYSQCELLGDSLIIEDQTLNSLIDNIFVNNNNVQTYLHPDGAIEYFDNKEKFQAKYPFEEIQGSEMEQTKIPKTKANYYDQFDGYAQMYADPNFEGLMVDAVNIYQRVPQQFTIPHDLFQKISSIKIYGSYDDPRVYSVLVCYDETSYQGYTLTTFAKKWAPHTIPDLRTIPCGKNGNWNDRICSVRFSVKIYDPFKP